MYEELARRRRAWWLRRRAETRAREPEVMALRTRTANATRAAARYSRVMANLPARATPPDLVVSIPSDLARYFR